MNLRTLTIILGLSLVPLWTHATQTVAYQWNTVGTYNAHHGNTGGPWQYDLVDGKLQVTLPAGTSPYGYYNYFLTPATTLTPGQQYTAEITFEVSTATDYPNYFYLFARNTAGTEHDIWQEWIGEPGVVRTITMPLDLAVIGSNTWRLYMGTKGPGSIIVHSLIIYNGLANQTELPVANAVPVSTLPSGVTAATGYTAFTPTAPGTSGATLSMANYNFVANSTSSAATNAAQLQQAINDCKAQGASTLTLPTGTYYLARSTAISINNLDDFTLDGQGSTLVFRQLTGDGAAILQQNNDRIVIKNLILDWDWAYKPIASLGVVSNLSTDKKQCDITFPDLDATQTALTRVTPWTKMFQMNSATLVREAPGIYSVPGGTTIAATATGNVLHVTFPSASPLVEGESYVIRHLYYEMCAFKVLDDTHLTYDAVEIRSMPGMGWLFEAGMKNWQLNNCHIRRATGGRTPLTTAADGIHVTESEGNLKITGCTFTGCGDDVINLHDTVYQGVATFDPADNKKLTLANCPNYRLRLKAGDTVQFYDADYDNLNGSATPVTRVVASTTSNNTIPQTVITFTTALPSALSPQAIVRNARFNTANVRIAGCEFKYTNGHGILLSTEDTTVENCYFRNVFSTPIQFEANIVQPHRYPFQSPGDFLGWSEGKGAANVVVRNNVFENNNQEGDSGGTSIWAGTSLPWGPTDVALFNTLLFEGNRFFNSPGPILSLNNCSNVIVRDNQTETSSLVGNATALSAAIQTSRSDGLALGGNTWIDWILTPYDYGVVYDDGTTTNLDAGTNVFIDMTSSAEERFSGYTAGSGFTVGTSLGTAGNNWAYGWRTANSLSTSTGTVLNTNPLNFSGNRLGVSIVTQANKTRSYGSVARAYNVTSTTSGYYGYSFRYRPDTTPSNIRYQLHENRPRTAGPDNTTTWQIASIDGTWQVLDGPLNGGSYTYVDTGMAVTAGTVYEFIIASDPVAHTWSVLISNGTSEVVELGLNWRFNNFTTDPGEAIGGRWINFGAEEIVSASPTVGATGTFSIDNILVQMPAP